MNRDEFEKFFSETLRSGSPTGKDFERVAEALVDVVASGEPAFLGHVRNRLGQIASATGEAYDTRPFDIESARALIADEIGFKNWQELINAADRPNGQRYPLLFQYAIAAMVRGDFSALDSMVGGPDKFDEQIVDWFEKGYFQNEPETLAEIFSAACMLGHPKTGEYLLDKGVDPYAGMRTGLSGFHYAASSGRLDVIKLLIDRKVPMEVENMYGGTVFGQAIWSAVNEHTPYHAEIVEELVKAGAVVDEEYREWWDEQDVPDTETKRRVAEVLRQHEKFHARVASAQQTVDEAESAGDKRALADSLKALGNLLRRPPFLRDEANKAYERAANLYKELDLPLEEAWVKRHIGINHEYAGRLEEAEKYYDEALALYRDHGTDDGNYANAVRYPAVIKERLGKKDESALLWEEAHDRYSRIGPGGLGEGVAEAAAWLAVFAIERNDLDAASTWFAKASEASSRSGDADTHKFIDDVRHRLEKARNS
jgi:hypothetical protein